MPYIFAINAYKAFDSQALRGAVLLAYYWWEEGKGLASHKGCNSGLWLLKSGDEKIFKSIMHQSFVTLPPITHGHPKGRVRNGGGGVQSCEFGPPMW